MLAGKKPGCLHVHPAAYITGFKTKQPCFFPLSICIYRTSQQKTKRMEFNHTADIEATNSSKDEELVTIYKALGTAHLIIVVMPTLVLASIVIYCMYILMKTSGVKPVSLLFLFLAILCMLGPLSYGILWDVSLITAIPILGNCTSQHPVYVVQYLLLFGLAMAISVTIAMIAVLQFMVLQCRAPIMVNYVIVVYAGLMVTSFGVSCIFFNGGYTEIYGSHCKAYPQSGPVNTAVWTFLAYAVPILLTVVFSIFTCVKVKRDVSSEKNSVVRSVVVLNTFNIFSYVVLRVGALLVYFTVVSINPTKSTVYLWTLLARYIGELNYPLTLFSVLIVHSSVRRMVFLRTKPTNQGGSVSMDSTA